MMGWWQARLSSSCAGLFGDRWWIFSICFPRDKASATKRRRNGDNDDCDVLYDDDELRLEHITINDVTDTDSGVANSVHGADNSSTTGSLSPDTKHSDETVCFQVLPSNENVFLIANHAHSADFSTSYDVTANDVTRARYEHHATLVDGVHHLLSHVYHVVPETTACHCDVTSDAANSGYQDTNCNSIHIPSAGNRDEPVGVVVAVDELSAVSALRDVQSITIVNGDRSHVNDIVIESDIYPWSRDQRIQATYDVLNEVADLTVHGIKQKENNNGLVLTSVDDSELQSSRLDTETINNIVNNSRPQETTSASYHPSVLDHATDFISIGLGTTTTGESDNKQSVAMIQETFLGTDSMQTSETDSTQCATDVTTQSRDTIGFESSDEDITTASDVIEFCDVTTHPTVCSHNHTYSIDHVTEKELPELEPDDYMDLWQSRDLTSSRVIVAELNETVELERGNSEDSRQIERLKPNSDSELGVIAQSCSIDPEGDVSSVNSSVFDQFNERELQTVSYSSSEKDVAVNGITNLSASNSSNEDVVLNGVINLSARNSSNEEAELNVKNNLSASKCLNEVVELIEVENLSASSCLKEDFELNVVKNLLASNFLNDADGEPNEINILSASYSLNGDVDELTKIKNTSANELVELTEVKIMSSSNSLSEDVVLNGVTNLSARHSLQEDVEANEEKNLSANNSLNDEDNELIHLDNGNLVSGEVLKAWQQHVIDDAEFDVPPASPTNANFLDSLSDVSFDTDEWFEDFDATTSRMVASFEHDVTLLRTATSFDNDVIKSPPPYTAATESTLGKSLPAVCVTPLDTPPFSVIPNNISDVTLLVNSALDICWQCRRYGEPLDTILPPQSYFSQDDASDSPESTSSRTFKRLVFDLVAEVLQSIYHDEEPIDQSPWSGPTLVRSQKFPLGCATTPTTVDAVRPIVHGHVTRCLGMTSDVRTLAKSNKWLLGRKANTVVDHMLVEELCFEEPEWTHYDHDVNTRKQQISDFLMEALIYDTTEAIIAIQRMKVSRQGATSSVTSLT